MKIMYLHEAMWWLIIHALISRAPIRRLIIRSLKVSKQRDLYLVFVARSLWYLTGTSAAVLPMCLSNFKSMRQIKLPISRLQDLARSYHKTSDSILKWTPGRFIKYTLGGEMDESSQSLKIDVNIYLCHTLLIYYMNQKAPVHQIFYGGL